MNKDCFEKLNHLVTERGKPFRILIVDDERWVREVFRDYCALTNSFEIDMARSGEEAIEMAIAQPYDLITLDLIMPEVSGLEALGAIKEKCPRVPVMIVTGNATEKLVHEAGNLGACRVMYKPVRLEDFITELVSRLGQ